MFGTWMIMAVEAPFVAAVIARMAEPKNNLAAFGVAYAVAILVESPVIMILSASTALVRGAESFRRLRRFTWTINALMTGVMLLLVLTPLWRLIATRLIGLPDDITELSRIGLLLMTLWPAAIGYRRFFQGLLIQSGRTRRVAYGTILRLATMAATSLALLIWAELPGVWVGLSGIGLGVVIEAAAARLMARHEVNEVLARTDEASPPNYSDIATFYWPLALTSMLSLAVHPVVTFFMGRGRFPLESLAVLPVVNSLTFVFRSIGLSFQEVAIALLGQDERDQPHVLRFGTILAIVGSTAMALMTYTPLAWVWFHDISGLSPELTRFAITPARILSILPALSVLLSLQRAILVHGRLTGPIKSSTAIEVVGIVIALMLLIGGFDMIGATAAAIAFLAGRIGGNVALVAPCRRVLSRLNRDESGSR
jgi:hypothetical protein